MNLVAVVFAVAILVRVATGLDALDAPFWLVPTLDELNHLELARRLLAGEPPPYAAFYFAPGYAYFLALVMKLGGGIVAAKILNLLAGATTAALVALLGMRSFGRAAGITAGIVWSLYPSTLLHELLLLKPALTTLCVVGAALALGRSHVRRWATAGALLGAATLLRGEILIAAALLLTASLVARLRHWPEAPRPAAIVAFAVLVVAAVSVPTLQNHATSGDFVVLAYGGGPNFYIGNHAGATGGYVALRPDRSDPAVEESDAILLANTAAGQQLRPGGVSRYWRQQGLAWWRAHPADALRLSAKKLALVWGQQEIADGLSTRLAGRWVALLRNPALRPSLVLPLALVGLWLARRRRDLWPLQTLVLGLTLGLVPFFLFERFRLPLVALSLPFAAFALTQAWSTARQRRWRPLATGAVMTLMLAVGLSRPRIPVEELALRAHVGSLLAQAGQLEAALVEYEAVRSGMPEAWRIDINIANAHAQLGNIAPAQAAIQRVLAHLEAEADTTQFPRHDDLAYCHELAAELARVQGDLPASLRHYRAALEHATPQERPRLQHRIDVLSGLSQ